MRIASREIYPFLDSLLRPVRGRTERAGWRLRLTDTSGRVGAGEAVCWPGFGAGERATSQALERLEGLLLGARLSDAESVQAWLEGAALPPEAAHAVSCALLDLLAQRAGRGFAALLGPARRAQVPCQALVADPAEARAALAAGYAHFKVKGHATSLQDDLERLTAIRAAIGPAPALRVDANGRWERAATLATLEGLHTGPRVADLNLTSLEQPLPPGDLAGLAALRAAGQRIAVDEGVRDLADLERHLAAGAIDELVLKPAFVGGPLAALRLAEAAAQAGLSLVVTHALDGEVGRLAALHLALVVPTLSVAGLAPALRDDRGPAGPLLSAPAVPGLGLSPREPEAAEAAEAAEAPDAPGALEVLASAELRSPSPPAPNADSALARCEGHDAPSPRAAFAPPRPVQEVPS